MSGGIETVEVYWRPGCPFCISLRRGLRRAGVATREVNIWDGDPAAAARVRAATGGNETVPTVFVGAHVMVAPRARDVLHLLRTTAPHLLPDPGAAPSTWGRRIMQCLGTGKPSRAD